MEAAAAARCLTPSRAQASTERDALRRALDANRGYQQCLERRRADIETMLHENEEKRVGRVWVRAVHASARIRTAAADSPCGGPNGVATCLPEAQDCALGSFLSG